MGRQGVGSFVGGLRRQEAREFVGREAQLVWFRDKLDGGGPGDRRRPVINVSGAGGVGKSWLLHRFQQIAGQAGALCASSDLAEVCVGEVMCRMAEQFAAQEQPLEHFDAGYSLYCQHRHEIDASPQAATRDHSGSHGGQQVAFAAEPWDLAAYVAQKARERAGQPALLKPVDVLTPLFLADLGRLAQSHLIVLFFDEYERTGLFLEPWLRELLDGRHGEAPANLLFVISGEHELDREVWAPYEMDIARLPLEPFSAEVAREYLAAQGVPIPVADTILELSDRLPLFLATLAAGKPETTIRAADCPGTAVECFLEWLRDPGQQRLVLDAALPRKIDRDVLAVLAGQEKAGGLLDWLKALPFVAQHRDGWTYHGLIRGPLLQIRQRETPEDWTKLQAKLAAHYETLRNGHSQDDGAGPPRGPGQQLVDSRDNGRTLDKGRSVGHSPNFENGRRQAYALEALYHRLCQAPEAGIDAALNGFLAALQTESSFARRWAQALEQAGEDAAGEGPPADRLREWGQRLIAGLSAQEEDHYLQAIDLLSALLDEAELDAGWRAAALDWRGALQVLAGEYVGAARDLSDAIRLAPETAEAWRLRGEAHRRLGREGEALADVSRALELEPNDPWALIQRATGRRHLGQDEEALADLDLALELDPEDIWALALRGATYWGMERYPEALVDLDQAIELRPDYIPALASRGNTLRMMGRYPEALADFDRVLALAPGQPWALARRGETHRQMGEFHLALADLDTALQLDPDDAFALASRGEGLRCLGRFPEALADLSRALEIEPNDAWVLARRGKTYRRLGQHPEALADFSRALALEPDDAWIQAERGATFLRLARYAEALTDLDQAVRQQCNEASFLAARGEAYRLARRRRKALADLNQALALDPDHAPARGRRAQTYRQIGRYPEALVDFDRALELQTDNAFVLRGRAETYRRLGQYPEALADFDRALELDPDSGWALARRGQAYAQMERYPEALADFDRALELRPDDIWTRYCRARAYMALDRADEARLDLASAVEDAGRAARERSHDWPDPFRGVLFRLARVEGA